MDAPKLHALTSIRFIAAMHVLWTHFGSEDAATPRWVRALRANAYVTLSMFFVLSGFILTYQYRDRFESGQLARRRFWLARFSRIYPLDAASGIIAALAVIGSRPGTELFWTTTSQLFGLQSWLPRRWWGPNGPSWSLSVEFFFYLTFPFLVGRLYKGASDVGLVVRMVAWWMLGMTALVLFLRLEPTYEENNWRHLFLYAPIARIPEFIIGMGVGHVYLRDRALGRRRNGTWLAVPALASIVTLMATHYLWLPGYRYFIYSHNGAFALLWAVMVYGLAHGGWFARVLENPVLVRLGDGSYATYILQMPLLYVGNRLLGDDWSSTPLFFWQYLAVILPISVVAHDTFQVPVQQWLRAHQAGAYA